MWSPAQVGEWLGLSEGVRKVTHRYSTGTGDKTRMLGTYAVAFHRSGSPVMEDPSSLKRFVTSAAGAFQVYRRELSAKLVEICALDICAEFYAAGCRIHLAKQQLQKRCFAYSVSADDANPVASHNRSIQTADYRLFVFAIRKSRVYRLNNKLARTHSLVDFNSGNTI